MNFSPTSYPSGTDQSFKTALGDPTECCMYGFAFVAFLAFVAAVAAMAAVAVVSFLTTESADSIIGRVLYVLLCICGSCGIREFTNAVTITTTRTALSFTTITAADAD